MLSFSYFLFLFSVHPSTAPEDTYRYICIVIQVQVVSFYSTIITNYTFFAKEIGCKCLISSFFKTIFSNIRSGSSFRRIHSIHLHRSVKLRFLLVFQFNKVNEGVNCILVNNSSSHRKLQLEVVRIFQIKYFLLNNSHVQLIFSKSYHLPL